MMQVNIPQQINFDNYVCHSSLYTRSLKPLLDVLNWQGKQQDIIESLPHLYSTINANEFCQIMRRLNFEVKNIFVDCVNLDKRLLPCLYVDDRNVPYVIHRLIGEYAEVFCSEKNRMISINRNQLKGTAYLFTQRSIDDRKASNYSWLTEITKKYSFILAFYFFLGVFVNLLTLTPPIFIMSVYDQIIATHDMSVLPNFFLGIFLALLGLYVLQVIRSHMMAHISTYLDRTIGSYILKKLLNLSPLYTETAPVGAQVARIKDFDNLREFFTTSIATILFDLPLLLIYFIALLLIGGVLAFIPLLTIGTLMIIFLILYKKIVRLSQDSANYQAKKREFLVESLDKLHFIRATSSEKVWLKRFRSISGQAAWSHYQVNIMTSLIASAGDVFIYLTGLLVITLGSVKVIQGGLSIGSLIAMMIIVWRFLSPLRAAMVAMTKIDQIKNSFAQINNLMKISSEDEVLHEKDRVDQLNGSIVFQRVSMRYGTEFEPSILGINFRIDPGQCLMIVGPNGSGKSTLIKLIMGLYPLINGHIFIDKKDVRHYALKDLHRLIGYVPQIHTTFYGTIAQNLRLSAPQASEEEMHLMLSQLGLDKKSYSGDLLDLHIDDYANHRLPTSFHQRFSLARALIKKPKILLLDEPTTGLDIEAELDMMKTIDQLKGQVTIIMATHRPSHLKYADVILTLEKGQVVDLNPNVNKEIR